MYTIKKTQLFIYLVEYLEWRFPKAENKKNTYISKIKSIIKIEEEEIYIEQKRKVRRAYAKVY